MKCEKCGMDCIAMADIQSGQTGDGRHNAVSTCCSSDIIHPLTIIGHGHAGGDYCPKTTGTGKETEQVMSKSVRKRLKVQQSASDEIREAFLKSGKKDRPEKFPSWIDGDDPYSIEPVYRQGFYIGYNTHKQKEHAEIEELTKSLGTYYDLNMKLEQQVKQLTEEDTQRLFNRLQKRINKLEQHIKDMKYAEEFH